MFEGSPLFVCFCGGKIIIILITELQNDSCHTLRLKKLRRSFIENVGGANQWRTLCQILGGGSKDVVSVRYIINFYCFQTKDLRPNQHWGKGRSHPVTSQMPANDANTCGLNILSLTSCYVIFCLQGETFLVFTETAFTRCRHILKTVKNVTAAEFELAFTRYRNNLKTVGT